MRHVSTLLTLCAAVSLSLSAIAQSSTSTGLSTATCNFDSEKQVAVQYEPMSLGKHDQEVFGGKIPYGKVWEPGRRALTLFTNTPLSVGGREIPIGAYTIYFVPQRDQWTLIVSKNTDPGVGYDESKDLARVSMQTGQLPSPEPDFSVYFAHTNPTRCSMRVDLADTRAWVPFEQK